MVFTAMPSCIAPETNGGRSEAGGMEWKDWTCDAYQILAGPLGMYS